MISTSVLPILNRIYGKGRASQEARPYTRRSRPPLNERRWNDIGRCNKSDGVAAKKTKGIDKRLMK
jgi:hypothetical protein